MLFVPQSMLTFPLKLKVGGDCLTFNDEKELGKLTRVPYYRLCKVLAERGILDCDDFILYNHGHVPYLTGIEDLCTCKDMDFPVFCEVLEKGIVRFDTVEELSEAMISSYKEKTALKLLAMGEDILAQDKHYSTLYYTKIHKFGVYGIDDLLRYTRGIIPVLNDMSYAMADCVSQCMPGDIPYRRVVFPVIVTFPNGTKQYDGVDDYKAMSIDILTAYKHHEKIEIIMEGEES